MTVFFYSIKGGQGKTTHAVGYAKHCGGRLITNDLDNSTADIYAAALGEGRIITLEPGQSVTDIAKHFAGERLIFDFGGFVESRIMDAAGIADVTVVPLTFQSTADLTPAVKTIMAVKPVAKTIVILINNTDPEHIADLKTILAIRFPKMPIFVVNHSRHISRLADDGQTVFDIAANGGIEKWQLRNILPQYKKLYEFLDRQSS